MLVIVGAGVGIVIWYCFCFILFGGSSRDEFFLSGYGDIWIEVRAHLLTGRDHVDITANYVVVVRSN